MTIPTDTPASDLIPQSEHSVSSDRLCASCGAPLTDRRPQARFCSDRCRTHSGREAQQQRLAALLNVLSEALGDLRRELCVNDSPVAREGK
jgi:predicted nucleic acid-binding Zn ribbon protein